MGWSAFDPCQLLKPGTVASVLGAPVAGGSGSGASGGGRSCTWTTAEGDTLTIATADPQRFEAKRAAAYGLREVPGLGSGAYSTTVGQREQLVVHGGSALLVIEASAGSVVAEAAARAMPAVLEVV